MQREHTMRRPDVLVVGADEAVRVSCDDSHSALQTALFYIGDANGVPLHEWTDDFLVPRSFWIDIVEELVPVP